MIMAMRIIDYFVSIIIDIANFDMKLVITLLVIPKLLIPCRVIIPLRYGTLFIMPKVS